MAWFDRKGNLLSAAGPRNAYVAFSLSPNENYAVINRFDDPGSALPTIWVMDLARESAVFRLTDADAALAEFNPVWGRNSREILLSRGDDQRMRLFLQTLTGGPGECVLDTAGPKFPADWALNGRFLAFNSQLPDYRTMHLWIAELGETGDKTKARPFLVHSYEEHGAQFSPSEENEEPHWIVYTSRETGRHEVCVRDFPSGSNRWQVSIHGGLQPHWRADGRELFYTTLDGMLMSVGVKPPPASNSVLRSRCSPPIFEAGGTALG